MDPYGEDGGNHVGLVAPHAPHRVVTSVCLASERHMPCPSPYERRCFEPRLWRYGIEGMEINHNDAETYTKTTR